MDLESRDWSSIQSKGFLPRSGESCRLRRFNKLRSNLKVGCKFSAEEERIEVESQARFGNKWATIASHLTGRTDNDVKNFWTWRKKRLARTLNSSSPSATSAWNLSKQKSVPLPQLTSNLEVPENSTSTIQVGAHPSASHNPLDFSSSRPLNSETLSSLQEPLLTVSDPLISTNPSAQSALSEPSWFTLQPNPAPVGDPCIVGTYTLPLLLDHLMKDLDLEQVFAGPTSCCQSFPCTNTYNFKNPFFRGSMEGSCCKSVVPVQRYAVGNLANNPDGFFDDFLLIYSLDPLPSSLDSFHSI